MGHLTYQLELPSHWNIHNVINITFLEPKPKEDDPFSQVQPPPDTVHNEHYPNKDDHYKVEKILTKQTRHVSCTRRLIMEYLVRWCGFDESHDEWKRQEQLEGARQIVQEFNTTG